MWALKAQNSVKNRVNHARFVNFNSISQKISQCPSFFFEILLSKPSGNQNNKFLLKTLVADFQNGSSEM